MDEIIRKDIRINDTIYVKRAGDVIPEVDRVSITHRKKSTKIIMPKKCPSCGTLLIKIPNQSTYKCLMKIIACHKLCSQFNILLLEKL